MNSQATHPAVMTDVDNTLGDLRDKINEASDNSGAASAPRFSTSPAARD